MLAPGSSVEHLLGTGCEPTSMLGMEGKVLRRQPCCHLLRSLLPFTAPCVPRTAQHLCPCWDPSQSAPGRPSVAVSGLRSPPPALASVHSGLGAGQLRAAGVVTKALCVLEVAHWPKHKRNLSQAGTLVPFPLAFYTVCCGRCENFPYHSARGKIRQTGSHAKGPR